MTRERVLFSGHSRSRRVFIAPLYVSIMISKLLSCTCSKERAIVCGELELLFSCRPFNGHEFMMLPLSRHITNANHLVRGRKSLQLQSVLLGIFGWSRDGTKPVASNGPSYQSLEKAYECFSARENANESAITSLDLFSIR